MHSDAASAHSFLIRKLPSNASIAVSLLSLIHKTSRLVKRSKPHKNSMPLPAKCSSVHAFTYLCRITEAQRQHTAPQRPFDGLPA